MSLPFEVKVVHGAELPQRVASFEDYQVARTVALRRLRLNAERQVHYVRIEHEGEVLFEASRIDNKELGTVEFVIDREMMP